MRVTIILTDDASVAVDGEGYGGLNLSFMDPAIHAVQWYDTRGVVEYKDLVTGDMVSNQEITDFTPYQQAITVWQAEKERVAAEMAAARARVIGGQPNVIAE
jgi:hypothetical protein